MRTTAMGLLLHAGATGIVALVAGPGLAPQFAVVGLIAYAILGATISTLSANRAAASLTKQPAR